MIKCGNLFEIARKELEKEKEDITPDDVIDRAILLRRKLDILEEIREHIYNRKYNLKRRKR